MLLLGKGSLHVVAASRTCQLALVLVLTFAPSAGVVFLPSTGANTPRAHVVVSTCLLQLALVV